MSLSTQSSRLEIPFPVESLNYDLTQVVNEVCHKRVPLGSAGTTTRVRGNVQRAVFAWTLGSISFPRL